MQFGKGGWKLKNVFESILESIYLSIETREKNPNMWRGTECEILKPYDLLSHQECVSSASVHFINTCQVVSTDRFFKAEFSCFGTTPNFLV